MMNGTGCRCNAVHTSWAMSMAPSTDSPVCNVDIQDCVSWEVLIYTAPKLAEFWGGGCAHPHDEALVCVCQRFSRDSCRLPAAETFQSNGKLQQQCLHREGSPLSPDQRSWHAIPHGAPAEELWQYNNWQAGHGAPCFPERGAPCDRGTAASSSSPPWRSGCVLKFWGLAVLLNLCWVSVPHAMPWLLIARGFAAPFGVICIAARCCKVEPAKNRAAWAF